MDEAGTSISHSPTESRRQFLKHLGVGLAAAGGTAAGLAVHSHEQGITSEQGVLVDGVYYKPLYEYDHRIGPLETLPPGTDGFFMENNLTTIRTQNGKTETLTQYTLPPEKVAQGYTDYLDPRDGNTYTSQSRVQILQQLQEQHIPFAVGDVGGMMSLNELVVTPSEDEKKFWEGVIATVLSFAPEGLRKAIQVSKPPEPPASSRRKFLGLSLAAVGTTLLAFGGAALGMSTATDTEKFQMAMNNADTPQPWRSLLTTINGFASDLHPENKFVFMRNVIMALKIKTMGSALQKDKNQPHIVYNVGAGHGGIEHLLYLPEDALRMLIASMGDFLSERSTRYTPQEMATTRLIQYDAAGAWKDKARITDVKLQHIIESVIKG